jgi:hypothetical protein
MTRLHGAPLFGALLLLAACQGTPALELPEPQPLAVPTGPGAAQPFVAAHGSDIVLSWTEPAEEGHALRFARFDGTDWGPTGTVAVGRDWFVNWADFPSVVAVDENRWAAHWLQRSGPGRYAYDVMLATSADAGASWSAPVRPHADGTETEHGFVSLFPHDGGAGVVWLDGRRFEDTDEGPATREMQLRFATVAVAAEPVTGDELMLDGRICDCCQTAVAVTGRGPVVFYRDRSPGEVRDISYTRLMNGAWSQPRPVHNDGWEINACPVNGPAADGRGDDVVVAWYTGAADAPRAYVAFSGDAGDSFTPPVRIDDGNPIGRVDVLFLDGGPSLVVWLERVGEDAEIRGRLVAADGQAGRREFWRPPQPAGQVASPGWRGADLTSSSPGQSQASRRRSAPQY